MNNYERVIEKILKRFAAAVLDQADSFAVIPDRSAEIFSLGKNVVAQVLEEEGVHSDAASLHGISNSLFPNFISLFNEVFQTQKMPGQFVVAGNRDRIVKLLWKLAPDLDTSGDIGKLQLTASEIRSEIEAYMFNHIKAPEYDLDIEEFAGDIFLRFGLNYEDLDPTERTSWTMGLLDMFTAVAYNYMHNAILKCIDDVESGKKIDPATTVMNSDFYFETIEPLWIENLVPGRVDSLSALCKYVLKLNRGGSKARQRAERIIAALIPTGDLYEVCTKLARLVKSP